VPGGVVLPLVPLDEEGVLDELEQALSAPRAIPITTTA
jgi:hypothetical protein